MIKGLSIQPVTEGATKYSSVNARKMHKEPPPVVGVFLLVIAIIIMQCQTSLSLSRQQRAGRLGYYR